jgi:hypothetical protein
VILEVRGCLLRIPFEAVRHLAILSSSRSFRELIGITIGAQPRAARDRFFDFAETLRARLVGCSALLGSPPVRSGDKGNRTVRGHG